jgi:hypothetical protein
MMFSRTPDLLKHLAVPSTCHSHEASPSNQVLLERGARTHTHTLTHTRRHASVFASDGTGPIPRCTHWQKNNPTHFWQPGFWGPRCCLHIYHTRPTYHTVSRSSVVFLSPFSESRAGVVRADFVRTGSPPLLRLRAHASIRLWV